MQILKRKRRQERSERKSSQKKSLKKLGENTKEIKIRQDTTNTCN